MITVAENIYRQNLTDKEFTQLVNIVYKISGIRLSEEKRSMAEGRIRKRIKALNFNSYCDYINHIKQDENLKSEIVELINVISTNKSDFFREPEHFKHLTNKALPSILNKKKYDADRKVRIWCAACSTGEEPYTIAITLNNYFENFEKFEFELIASDISTKVLNSAFQGIYDKEKLDSLDINLVKKYFLKGKTNKSQVRVIPQIRKSVKFFRQNLMDDKYKIPELQDIIFCRNVLIYFSKDDQQKVINKLSGCLNEGGYLITGHSETLTGMKTRLQRIESTIYQK